MIYLIPTDTCFWLACSVKDKKWYEKIYELKWRDFQKPLAIMIENIGLLNNCLNIEQLNFLSKYKSPWTILTNNDERILNLCLPEKILKKNDKKYQKMAIRIANNEVQKKLIKKIWTIFLTSANLSGEKEIYSLDEINKIFWVNNTNIEILAKEDQLKVSPSDIFEFVWDTTEIIYLRKY